MLGLSAGGGRRAFCFFVVVGPSSEGFVEAAMIVLQLAMPKYFLHPHYTPGHYVIPVGVQGNS